MTRKKAFFIAITIGIAVGLLIGTMTFEKMYKPKHNIGEKTNVFTALFKKAPKVSATPDIDLSVKDEWIYLGIDIETICNDNYNKIIVKVDLINHSEAIYKTDYVIFENCEEGETYQKDYHLTADEILKTKDIRCELYKYT